MNVLVLNCGSSSIKYRLFKMPRKNVLAKGEIQRIGDTCSRASQSTSKGSMKIDAAVANHDEGFSLIEKLLADPENGALRSFAQINAFGHRVVHGGETFTESVIITPDVERAIDDYAQLAPLHNPSNLCGIRSARNRLPEIPQVACFDTAFHQTIPDKAFLYGLPYEIYQTHRVRRYGFHGISHKYIAHRAATLLGRDIGELNLITCHLGNGCSITAVKNGISIDTSMGFTPLEGLIMGTRTGDVDPAVIFYLIRNGYSPQELDSLFNKKSGLLGLSGISNDIRDLERLCNEKRARLALDAFAWRIRKTIGSCMAILDGCDAVVFSGGIGENGAAMRRRILEKMDCLGITVDWAKNAEIVEGKEGEIGAGGSRVGVLVIPTDEETAIAVDTFKLVCG